MVKDASILTFEGHKNSVYAVAFSPDGKNIVSGSTDCTIKVWDISTKEMLREIRLHPEHPSSVAVSPDGKHLASCSSSRSNDIKIWDYSTGKLLHKLEGHARPLKTLTKYISL